MSNRYSIKLGGESGQGINTLGLLLSKVLKSSGYNIFSYREYPSLIKGGVASYQIDFSDDDINSSSKFCNILAILDPDSINKYIYSLSTNGILIYDDKIEFTPDQTSYIQKQNISPIYIDTQTIATSAGGSPIMANIVMTSFIWKLLNLSQSSLGDIVKEIFADKGEAIIDKNLKCISAGYNAEIYEEKYNQEHLIPNAKEENKEKTRTKKSFLSICSIKIQNQLLVSVASSPQRFPDFRTISASRQLVKN